MARFGNLYQIKEQRDKIMGEFGILSKFVRLAKVTLDKTNKR